MKKFITLLVFSLAVFTQAQYVEAKPEGNPPFGSPPFASFQSLLTKCVPDDASVAEIRDICIGDGGQGDFATVTRCPPMPVAEGSGAFPVGATLCDQPQCPDGEMEISCKILNVPNN